ncbi:hypothetical protein [Rhizobacter sp. P5_C2]
MKAGVDKLLANAEREVNDALEKESLTTLLDHHEVGISETLGSILPVTCSGRPDVDATQDDFTVHGVLEGFTSKHLEQLRAAADKCDVRAFEELLEKASVDLGGGPRERPLEASLRAMLPQVTSCITELESALKPLLSAHLERFQEQRPPRQPSPCPAPRAFSDQAVSTCLATLQRAADRGHARAYLAALAELRSHPLGVVTFPDEISDSTMQAQV